MIGIFCLAETGYQEFHGTTNSPKVGGRYSIVSQRLSHKIIKANSPEEFRRAMDFHWFFSGMFLFLSFLCYKAEKMQAEVDPMAPDPEKK